MTGQIEAKRDNTVLVIVDVQEKLFPRVVDSEGLKNNIIKLIKFAKIMGIHIILTEQYPQGLGRTIEEIRSELDDYSPIEKSTFSCFGVEKFEQVLLDTTCMNLAVAGIETHVCVFQTVRNAIDSCYDVHLISDAVSSRADNDKTVGIERMRSMGATISSTEMFIFEVLKKAGTAEFKEVAPLLK